jgi:riboflavin synthase
VFTGLVPCVGTIVAAEPREAGRRLVVAAALRPDDRTLGASVSHAGVCLTVVDATADRHTVEAAFETLARTTLGALQVGDRVNVEPSLRVGDPLGGHLVSGHVDGLGTLRSCEPRGDAWELWFDAPPELLPLIAPKGSIAVDGVSLTVNGVDASGFTVGIIPHTWSATTLGGLAVGQAVNLEVDLLARYVARLLGASSGGSLPGGVPPAAAP